MYLDVSGDGRYVVFESVATNLVPGVVDGIIYIFLRDTQNDTTTLVSVSSEEIQGNLDLTNPSISANGAFVVFSSYATNLIPGDTNGQADVFKRDIQRGITTLVSANSNGVMGNNYSQWNAISADGRYVIFQSAASNLIPGDMNGFDDIFLRDTLIGSTIRLSVNADGDEANGTSRIFMSPDCISADGRFVVFELFATNLVANDVNGWYQDIFLVQSPTEIYLPLVIR